MKVPRVFAITQEVDREADTLGFVHSWLERLSERVEKLDVLALRVGAHELPANVHVRRIDTTGEGAGRMRRAFHSWFSLWKGLRGARRAIVFCHMCPQYVLAAYPFARLRGARIVYWQTHGRIGWLQRLAHRFADRVLTASPESFPIRSKKVCVIGHGVDTDWFRPPPGEVSVSRTPGRPTILGVGRIASIKSWETLIEAAGTLVHRHGRKDLLFRIVGGDACEAPAYGRALRARVEAEGLGDWVEFAGPVPHGVIRDHYWSSDIFVSTSLTGSIDKVVLEAMACGLPPLVCAEAFRGMLGPYADRLM
ncbi:MAG: glycosyltransferase family 4 protein, partial [Nitrospinota bacterium]